MLRTMFLTSLMVVGSIGFCQETTVTTSAEKSSLASLHGLRLTLFRPILKIETGLKAEHLESMDNSIDEAWGAALGYAQLPPHGMAWTTNLAMLQAKDQRESVTGWRVDGNLGFAFNRQFHAKAGFNLSNFYWDKIKKESPFVGNQVSVGYQFSPHIGFEVAYVVMRQSATVTTGSFTQNLDFTESGPEIAITGTY